MAKDQEEEKPIKNPEISAEGQADKENKKKADKADRRKLVEFLFGKRDQIVQEAPVETDVNFDRNELEGQLAKLYVEMSQIKDVKARKDLQKKADLLEKQIAEPEIQANLARGQYKREIGVMLDQWAKVKDEVGGEFPAGILEMRQSDINFLFVNTHEKHRVESVVKFFDNVSEYSGRFSKQEEKKLNLDALLKGKEERKLALGYVYQIVSPLAREVYEKGPFVQYGKGEKRYQQAEEEMEKALVVWRHILGAVGNEDLVDQEEISNLLGIERSILASNLYYNTASVWDVLNKRQDPQLVKNTIAADKEGRVSASLALRIKQDGLSKYGTRDPGRNAEMVRKILEATSGDFSAFKKVCDGFFKGLEGRRGTLKGASDERGKKPLDIKYIFSNKGDGDMNFDVVYNLVNDVVEIWIKNQPDEPITETIGPEVYNALRSDFNIDQELFCNILRAEIKPWRPSRGSAGDKEEGRQQFRRNMLITHAKALADNPTDAADISKLYDNLNKRLAVIDECFEEKK